MSKKILTEVDEKLKEDVLRLSDMVKNHYRFDKDYILNKVDRISTDYSIERRNKSIDNILNDENDE
tara:strand:- start:57520 stop:57717 length:198 start_codon:yes stop_codon:yes gene_type:complete